MNKPKPEVQAWFRYARVDLNMAITLLENGTPEMWRGVTYNCQQCAEKAVKGLLVHEKIKFTKTHDIGSLSTHLQKKYPEQDTLLKSASLLSKYALYYRYPDSQPEPLTLANVQSAIATAKLVLEKISSLISPDFNWE